MSFESGERLGPYEIRGKIGEGGMGAVYRAVDTRLGREVAIKVLPAAFVGDAERRARFEREAKLLASLNHSNIAQLYGVEEGPAGTLALILELVEGTTLDERLGSGALPVDESIAIAAEIAAALADAHDKGIVHRDLKPQNVRITPAGSVKVLDFGLAKALAAVDSVAVSSSVANSPTLMNSPTMTAGATELGMILGTAAYMSPEQARGRPVDRRADVWAFGCVLFEMLSGERLFAGETASDTLAAVLRREIPWERLPRGLPHAVRLLLRRCLERDPKRRLRDLGDAALLLSEPDERPVLPEAAPPAAPRRSALAIAALAGLALGLALAWGWMVSRTGASGAAAVRSTVLAVRMPPGVSVGVDFNTGQNQLVAISRDGRRIAFSGSDGGRLAIYLRELERKEVRAIAGTEGGTGPFFSSDGNWLGFFARGKLMKVALSGGEPVALADAGLDRGAVWLTDGTIVFAPGPASGLLRLPSSGGTAVEVTKVDESRGERSHRWPAVLPGGKEVAFTVGTTQNPGDYEAAAIDAVELATGKRRRLLEGASMARFTPAGQMLLGHEGELQAIPLAAADGGAHSDATKVLLDVDGDPASGVVYFDVADDGTLVYAERNPRARERTLAWVDRDGKVTPLNLPPREYRIPRISPDGRRIAVGIGRGRGGAGDIWIADLATETLQRLTFDGTSANPVWARDGKSVTYTLGTPRPGMFAEKRADGTTESRVVAELEVARGRGPLDWAPDGSLLFSEDNGPGFGNDILRLLPGDPEPRPVVQTSVVEIAGTLSPDGGYVAYSANISGASTYFVQSFPGPGGRWQVAEGNGGTLRWGPDGKALYVRAGSGIYEVPIDIGPPFRSGKPRFLIPFPYIDSEDVFTNFDVAPDGRFLVIRRVSDEPVSDRLVVALNWFETLNRQVPPRAR